MTRGSNTFHFFYDAQGRPAIVNFNGSNYAYLYNLQGDVIALVNSSGTKVVEYTYDAWGKLLTRTGSMASTLGLYQPFRYRGYLYDPETGFYYLRSRYYNPTWCRFINADSLVKGNLYCYCGNGPACAMDWNGFDAIWIQEAYSAEGFGHSGLFVQDENENWYCFYWGPKCEEFDKELVLGTETKCLFEFVAGPEADMSSTAAIKQTLRNSSGEISRRADLITSTYYFEGDYTNTYSKAREMEQSDDSYSLLFVNCAQQTLSAFMASDTRFSLIVKDFSTNVIPNVVASRVALLPRKKEEFPWLLVVIDAFERQTIY